MTNRSRTKLAGKIHIKHGFPFKSEYFSDRGELVVLTPGNFLEEGGFKRNKENDKYYVHHFPEEYLLEEGDLLVAMTEQAEGLLGSMAFVPESGKFLHNQRLGLVTARSTDISLEYLYHLFRAPWIRKQIRLTSTGSKVKHTSPEKLYDVEVELPDRKAQENIATLLNSIDAKVDLNGRLNEELEAAAEAIYGYWFVQFDFPTTRTQAKTLALPDLEGKPYRSSGGPMVYNEFLKREVPDLPEWRAEPILESCDVIDCLHSKKPKYYHDSEGNFLLQLENLRDDGLIDLREKHYVSLADYKEWTSRIEVSDGDLLITNAGRVAANVQVPEKLVAGIGRNITAVRPRTIAPTFLFRSFRGEDIRRQISWNTDSGAFFKSFNVKGIKKLRILRPDTSTEHLFEEAILPIRRLRENNNAQNEALIELRDWLLPMLMNGQATLQVHTGENSKTGA